MKLKLLLFVLFTSMMSWGQVTIASQDFETTPATPTWTYTNTNAGTSTTNTGTPANRIRNGLRSFQTSNLTTSLTFGNINVSAYNDVKIIVRIASISSTTGNGADATDYVRLFTNINGAGFATNTQANSDITVNGNSNSRWGFNSTGISTNAGTSSVVSGTSGTNAGTIYSTLIINIPNGTTTAGLRINTLNDDTNEIWCIDDVTIEGTLASTNTITTDTSIAGSPFCISSSTGATVNVPFVSTDTFTSNTYTAQLSNATGTFGSPVNIGTLVSDANAGTILATIPAGTAVGTGYRIRVVSNSPVVTGTNNTVDLVIQNPASIVSQPSTTVQNRCVGVAASALTITAVGTGLSYQWYSNTTASNSGGTTVGTNSNMYTPSTATAGTLYYYCVVTGTCGSPATSNVSGAVNVTAIPATPTGTISVSASPSCGAATFTYSPSSANLYWQTASNGTSTANPTTATSTTLAIAGTYTRYVRELNGTCWSPEISLSVSVVAPVSIGTQPPNRVITDGNNTTFNVAATGSSLTYQWQVDTGSGFNNIPTGAPYSNETTNTLNITNATISMNGYLYRCVVSGATPCTSQISNSGSLTVTLTAPNNPTSISVCDGNTTADLSWTASSGGSAPDGYMVFALAGGTTPAATVAAAGNSILYTANADFSAATTVTASLGKCLYKGTGTSFTVTGLTNLANYSFKVVAYRGATGTGWSSGINTNGTWNSLTTNVSIDMPEVSALTATVSSGQSAISWTRPLPLACNDEYLVVANQGAVIFTPSGNGSAYTANAVYAGANQVVYKGTGTGFTVTGLTNGLNYCYKVFVRKGTEWSNGVEVCQKPDLYCIASGNMSFDTSVTNVTFNTINNTNLTKTNAYQDNTAISTTVQRNNNYNFSMNINTDGNYTVLGFAWIDFNRDGDFTDIGEGFDLGQTVNNANGSSSSSPINITIPLSAALGATRMRVMATYDGDTSPCLTGFDGEVEDYTIIIDPACTPTHSITSFVPNTGSAGTEVAITGTGFTAGSTVQFNGINATATFNSATSLTAIVPTGTTTGAISVFEAGCELESVATFTQINQSGTCTGTSTFTDLIISEVYDSNGGNSWYMELYNPTGNTIDLDAAGANYKLVRYGDIGTTNAIRTVDITGTIAPGGVYLADLGSNSSCGALGFDFIAKANGINENDEIQLTKNDVIVDRVHCPNQTGYTITRNNGVAGPSATFNAAHWTTSTSEACGGLGTVPYTVSSNLPTVSGNNIDITNCTTTSGSFDVNATAFGAGSLSYQWYYNTGIANGWSIVNTNTFAGITASGTTSATLNLNGSIGNISSYQFYCLVTQDGVCSVASNTSQIKISATTWNGTSWTNGFPSISSNVIIDGAYNTGSTAPQGSFDACSVTVNNNRTLTIAANTYVNIQNQLTNNGTVTVNDSGSLIQVNDTPAIANTGNITVQRNAANVVNGVDYVYWSAPVAGQTVNGVFSGTSPRYRWETTTLNANSGQGNWIAYTGAMEFGNGYIVRDNNAATFTGVPHNGVYTPNIYRGDDFTTPGPQGMARTATDDNWNLLGNPYPSAIDVLSTNGFLDINTQLEGFVKIWTHANGLVTTVDPFYQNFDNNYQVADYATYNRTGSSVAPGDFKVASGQGFFVLMDAGPRATSTVTFRNSMRSKDHVNNQFFRNSNNATPVTRNRIWIDLVTATGTNRILIGYVSGATNGLDRMFDAFTDYKPRQNFYSIVNNKPQIIQGKALPFENTDFVPMGFKTSTNGNHTIALATVDGLFANNAQTIYLEDKLLDVWHNLSANPYTFTATTGTHNNRFNIRYLDRALSINNFEAISNNVSVFANSTEINIQSGLEKIKSVVVYNVIGQELASVKTTNFDVTINSIPAKNQTLLVKVILANGNVVTKKVIQ